ncbi:uncharacterized protein TNCV_685161 [Trichonephila clavipes]|nr:uncharacterized protein TNCV_685161 [Trichonephila clavipes]
MLWVLYSVFAPSTFDVRKPSSAHESDDSETSGTVVSDSDCCAVECLGSNPGEDIDVCKCIVPSRNGGTINSPLPFASQVLSCGWWKGKRDGKPMTTPGVFSQNCGGNEPNHTVTCVELKATANDRRHLALFHDEFREARSGLYRTGGLSNNNNNILCD